MWKPIDEDAKKEDWILGYDYGDYVICKWTEISGSGDRMGWANEPYWSNPYTDSFRTYTPSHYQKLTPPKEEK